MKKAILLIFIVSLLNCNNKKTNNNKDVIFEIENLKINSKDILTIKIVNKTNEDYFIILDTNRVYDYLTLNYKINNSILLKPKIFSDKDSIRLKIEFYMDKLIDKNVLDFDCIQKERLYTQKIMNSIKKLSNIIIIKKKSSFIFKIPFNSNFYDCSRKYSYLLKKGEIYNIQFQYKMDEKLINEIVNKTQIKKLSKKGVNPYFEKIISNKVPLIY